MSQKGYDLLIKHLKVTPGPNLGASPEEDGVSVGGNMLRNEGTAPCYERGEGVSRLVKYNMSTRLLGMKSIRWRAEELERQRLQEVSCRLCLQQRVQG